MEAEDNLETRVLACHVWHGDRLIPPGERFTAPLSWWNQYAWYSVPPEKPAPSGPLFEADDTDTGEPRPEVTRRPGRPRKVSPDAAPQALPRIEEA